MASLLTTLAIAATVAIAVFSAPPSRATQDNVISSPDTAGDVGLYASLELDASGLPVISYFDETNGDLKLLRCDDPACSGGGESIVSPDTEGEVGRATALVLDAAGNPVVSYKDGAGALKVLHCGDQDCMSGNSIVVIGLAPPVEDETSLALDAAGIPVIAYQSADELHLVVVRCGDVDCSSEYSIATPDTGALLGAYARVAIDGDGNPIVAYRDASSDDLKVLHCGNATCTNGNTITAPATSGNIGTHISLELDDDGNPVISFRDGNSGALRLLRCGNQECSSGNVLSPLFSAVGWSTSLALDDGGRAVVAYYDTRVGSVELLRCGDLDCTADFELREIATAVDVPFGGTHIALELDAAGLPIVAYFDGADADLRVLHCADPSCAGKPPTPTPTPPPVAGDANCDRVVTSLDAALILQIDVGFLSPPPPCTLAADVNVDGTLNSIDASLILQFVAGLLHSLPP